MLLRACRQRFICHDVKAIILRVQDALYCSPSTSQYSTSCRAHPLHHVKGASKSLWPIQSQPSRIRARSLSTKAPSDDPETIHQTSTTEPSPIPATLRIPTQPQSHSSLTTFLQHASQTSLSQSSTTYLGTRYEYLIQTHLITHLSFTLTRTGGRGDSGIDLLGTWNLPHIIASQTSQSTTLPQAQPLPPPIKVLIQCKRFASLKTKAGPNLIRELEGSIRGAPSTFRNDTSTLSVLVCSRPATKGVRDAMGNSAKGLMWCFIEEVPGVVIPKDESSSSDGSPSTEDKTSTSDKVSLSPSDDEAASDTANEHAATIPRTRIRQILWNRAAAMHCGLEGLDVGMRYVNQGVGSGKDEKEVVLLWQGKPLNFNV